jgi:hypothetical protein
MPAREFTLTTTAAALIGSDLTLAAIRLRELARTDDDRTLVQSLRESRDRLRKFQDAPRPSTVTISYQIHADDSHSRGTIELPSWAAGDPQMAVALHFFGERTSVGFVTKAEVL